VSRPRLAPSNPLIVAVDTSGLEEAGDLAASVSGVAGMLKAGLELYTAVGPESVSRLREHLPVFLDLKIHDIPHTAGRAARVAGRLGTSMLTVHALGGPEMVSAAVAGAREGAEEAGIDPPAIVGVTVLSSLAEQAGASPASLAFEAAEAGAEGVVVSGDDVSVVREALEDRAFLVVPGIRPSGHGSNGHARVLTPAEALRKGADYLVVGRPVTEAPDPAAAARQLLAEAGR
jgi:orotidine-5'-phosphate decarboxylase